MNKIPSKQSILDTLKELDKSRENITIGDVMEYIEQLAIDNPSLMDAPIHDFEIEDADGKKFVIVLDKRQ
jgi:hypothetical protein